MSETTKTQHTPGPWEVDTVPTQVGVCHRIGPFPSRGPETYGYACIYVDGDPAGIEGTDTLSAELRANARLIAAAPGLLAACKALLAAYGEAHALYDLGECDGSLLARTAIAKAEGR